MCTFGANFKLFICTAKTRKDKEEIEISTENHQNLGRAIASVCLSQFAEIPIKFIAGFVASSLLRHLKCKICIGALVTLNEDKSFVAYRELETRVG